MAVTRPIPRDPPVTITVLLVSIVFSLSSVSMRTTVPPYFSVVIPTYNRLDMLHRVLDALAAQEDAPEHETIVIDDGSTDDTDRAMSQRRGIIFRTQPNGGPGRARNHGVTLASGKFVVF